MKIPFLILGLISGLFLAAQEWRVLPVSGNAYYQVSPDGMILATRIDSVVASGDSVHLFSFRMIQRGSASSMIRYLNRGSWIGERISLLPGGKTLFRNADGREICIETRAEPGESWEMYRYPDQSVIQAEVLSKDAGTVLGQADSIKIIALSFLNPLGEPVTGPDSVDQILQTQVYLSKSHGLVRTPGFLRFPETAFDEFYMTSGLSCFDLIGQSDPPAGWQNFGWSDIYGFQPGDEIHTHSLHKWEVWYPKITELHLIQHFLGPNLSSSPDSLSYQTERCFLEGIMWPADSFSIRTGHDTVLVTFNLEGKAEWAIQKLPGEPGQTDFGYGICLTYPDSKSFSDNHSFYAEGDTLYPIMVDPGNGFPTYMKWRGGPYYTIDGGPWGYDMEELLFWNVWGISGGIPLSCSQLLSQVDLATGIANIDLYPNPASDRFQINFPSEFSEWVEAELVSVGGKRMWHKLLRSGTGIMVADIPDGVYVIKVRSGRDLFYRKLVVVH